MRSIAQAALRITDGSPGHGYIRTDSRTRGKTNTRSDL